MKIGQSINIVHALMWRHDRLAKTFHFIVKHRLECLITKIIVGNKINTSDTKHKATYIHKSPCKILIYGQFSKLKVRQKAATLLDTFWVWSGSKLGVKISQKRLLQVVMPP